MSKGKWLLTFLVCFSVSLSYSQIIFDKTKYDFGDLTSTDNRFVDIKLTNKDVKKAYVLSIKKPAEIVYLINGQFMDKDSSITLRLQVNPSKKGRFSYEVLVYTSDKGEATVLKLTGNLKDLPSDEKAFLQACPDFNTKGSSKNEQEFTMTVITIDKLTREPLAESSVTMIQNGRPTNAYKTNSKGAFSRKFTLGFTYLYATHDGYFPAEMGAYVNFQRNYIVIEMQKNPAMEQPVPDMKPTPEAVKDTVTHEIEIVLEEELKNENPTPIASTTETPAPAFDQLDKENFDVNLFKPVNIVFVLDISASMKSGEKMELMKYSLYQLTEMLRAQDQIAIVTYSTDAQILLTSIHGNEKDQINAKVDALKAAGLTAGGDGIKLGYKEALKHYLKDGVNQVIVITDGAFNRNSGDYQKYIKKYRKRGVNLSVVGIQNSEKDKINMEEVAHLGGGRYVPIFKLVDAKNNLKQEIRWIAFKK